nr:Malate:quinone oxidoreductase [Klebsiella pneumoniae]
MGTDVNYGEITRQLIGSLKKITTSPCRPPLR